MFLIFRLNKCLQARFGRWHRRVQGDNVKQTIFEFPSDQNEPGVCSRTVGRSAAGARVPAKPQPRARFDSKCKTGAAQHHQQFVRPTDWLPHLRLAAHDQLRRNQRATLLHRRRST